MLLPTDQQALREHWYRTGWYQNQTIPEHLATAAKQHPRGTVVWDTERGSVATSLPELHAQGAVIARALHHLGLRRHDVIAQQLPNSVEGAVLLSGALALGLVVVPIVHSYASSEVEFILRQSGAKALVVPDHWHGIDFLARAAQVTSVSALEHVIVVGERTLPGGPIWSGWAAPKRRSLLQSCTATTPACSSTPLGRRLSPRASNTPTTRCWQSCGPVHSARPDPRT